VLDLILKLIYFIVFLVELSVHIRNLTLENLILLLNQISVENIFDHIIFFINDFLELFNLGFERLVFDELLL